MDDLPKLLGFVLLVGFGGCLFAATALAAISKAVCKIKFSWRVIFGTSAALAIVAVVAVFGWLLWAARATY